MILGQAVQLVTWAIYEGTFGDKQLSQRVVELPTEATVGSCPKSADKL